MLGREGALPLQSLFHHKKEGRHYQGHVVMPAYPTLHLVILHSARRLGILERSLDPVALRLRLCQFRQGRFLRCVAQGVFDFARCGVLPGDQMTGKYAARYLIPYPNRNFKTAVDDLSLGGRP